MDHWTGKNAALHLGDCRAILPTIPSRSVHAVIADSIYPEINRDHGRISESDWLNLMRTVVREVRRILVPRGSAVFLLQANSKHIGSMRSWLWKFMAWVSEEWNIIQDSYVFNPSTPPSRHVDRKYGLMRPAVKHNVWLGSPDAYRNQDAVLLPLSESMQRLAKNGSAPSNDLHYSPSGMSVRRGRIVQTALERGGVTPYNLLIIPNSNSRSSSGAAGHGAGTPYAWCEW